MSYLDNINSPADVKKLSLKELEALAEEIRSAVLNRDNKSADMSVPTSALSKQPLPCITFLTRRKTRLCMTFRISPIRIRF